MTCISDDRNPKREGIYRELLSKVPSEYELINPDLSI